MKRFCKFIWILLKALIKKTSPFLIIFSIFFCWIMLIYWGDQCKFNPNAPIFVVACAWTGIVTAAITIACIIFFVTYDPICFLIHEIKRAWIKSKD